MDNIFAPHLVILSLVCKSHSPTGRCLHQRMWNGSRELEAETAPCLLWITHNSEPQGTERRLIFLEERLIATTWGEMELLAHIRNKNYILEPKEFTGASLNIFMQFRLNDHTYKGGNIVVMFYITIFPSPPPITLYGENGE